MIDSLINNILEMKSKYTFYFNMTNEKFLEDITERIIGLKKLFDEIDDIQVCNNRWNKKLMAKSVNNKLTDVQFTASCGCCPDAVVYAEAWAEVNGYRVYGAIDNDYQKTSMQIQIGEFCMGGISRYEKWEDSVREAGWPEEIINKINKHLDNNPIEEDYWDEDKESVYLIN